MTNQRTGRTRASIVGGRISIANGWSLAGGSFSTKFAWVSGGTFSIPIGIMPGADLLSSAALVAGAPTMSQPSAAGFGAGASVAGGHFTLTGSPAAAAISTPAASITGGQFGTTARNIPGGAFSAAASINAGFAGGGPSGGILSAGATMVGGLFAATQTGAALSSTASVVGGVYSGGSADPYFSNVSLLLPFNGANGSTTFTDQSLSARTPATVVNTSITTAQSKFGGSSAAFGGNGYIAYAPATALQFDGDFTLEGWFYLDSDADMIFGSSSSDENTQVFRFFERSGNFFGNTISFYLNGQYVMYRVQADIQLTTWHHVALTRVKTSTRAFVDGNQKGPTATYSGTFRMDFMGALNVSGGIAIYHYFSGKFNQFRATKGIARYTANFTPPTAPFPNS